MQYGNIFGQQCNRTIGKTLKKKNTKKRHETEGERDKQKRKRAEQNTKRKGNMKKTEIESDEIL